MKVIPYPFVIQLGNQEIRRAKADGGARVKLCHYTSVDTLTNIIRDKTIKLNRIDLVNDLTEKSYLGGPEIYCCVFIGCFSHRYTESIPQWHMYTPSDEGICISFTLKGALTNNCTGLLDISRPLLVINADGSSAEYFYNNQFSGNLCTNSDSHWHIELSSTDIIYSSKLRKDNPILRFFDGNPMIDLVPIAKAKIEAWDFEEETRVIGVFRTTHEGSEFEVPEYILLPIKLNELNIEIKLNPWSTDKFESKVESLCNAYLSDYSYRIVKSELHGTLAPRKW